MFYCNMFCIPTEFLALCKVLGTVYEFCQYLGTQDWAIYILILAPKYIQLYSLSK